jgi:hypothetical protein
MNEVDQQRQNKRPISRRGQSLAEFAITLPILLLLLFGIIEFGRIFQAWVTLQNAARAAARYATTGQYDSTAYLVRLEIIQPTSANPDLPDDLNSVVPCDYFSPIGLSPAQQQAQREAQRGTLDTLYPNEAFNAADMVEIYQGGTESLFATWYGGDDCDPTDPTDQDRRKDMVRILSIYDEARRGAAGLSLAPNFWNTPTVGVPPLGTYDPETVPWYSVWYRPFPGDPDGAGPLPGEYNQPRYSDQPGWFDMMICSSRTKLQNENNPQPDQIARRFQQVIDGTDPRRPVCLLQEEPATGTQYRDTFGWSQNANTPWLDAGGPGDTIWITITFNHPLITPLGLGAFLPLQARRTAVNEAFRSPSSAPPLGNAPVGGGLNGTPTPTATSTNTLPPDFTASATPSLTLTPSETATPSLTHTPTQTLTPSITPTASNTQPITPSPTSTLTPSRTPTNTATAIPAFDCATHLTLSPIQITGSTVRYIITNSYVAPTTLKRVTLVWPDSIPGYTSIAVFQMTLGGGLIFSTLDSNSSTDVGVATNPPGTTPTYPFAPAANVTLSPGTTTLVFTFANAPTNLATVMSPHQFNGTTLYADDIDSVPDCVLSNVNPTPMATATLAQTATATPTPACIPGLVGTTFTSYDNNTAVRFTATNFRNVPATMVGFNFNWLTRGTGLYLYQVWGATRGSATGPSVGSGSVLMWQAIGANQDNTPPSRGYNPTAPGYSAATTEGNWLANMTVPPGEFRYIWLVFRGASTTQTIPQWNAAFNAADYNGSSIAWLVPNCPVIDIGGPGGGVEEPTVPPQPTLTPIPPSATTPPTETFTLTFTPSLTLTPSTTLTRSATFTPSSTRTPSPTFTRSSTFTPSPTRTPSQTATITRSPTHSRTPTSTFTPSRTPSLTPSVTNTPEPTIDTEIGE